ncbi:MAG: hypothetical protein LBG16_02700 [Elusimicrobiota bacterium]|jgi:hypothetical protein|nr:hypothetical protein [Elusimicrobiota bacterium]
MKSSSFIYKISAAVFLCVAAVVAFAQRPQANQPEDKTAPAHVFKPETKRDPFMSKQEIELIESARIAEQKRRESERKRLEDQEKARRAEIEKQRLLEEELRKNPAREIINKIRVDGIVANEVIINGSFKGVGDSVLGARITKVSGTGVTFIYKGQTFVKKVPVTSGVGVL